jgi:hypothetical protein
MILSVEESIVEGERIINITIIIDNKDRIISVFDLSDFIFWLFRIRYGKVYDRYA